VPEGAGGRSRKRQDRR